MHRLKYQQRPSQIPPTLLRNPLIQSLDHTPPLLLSHTFKHPTNLFLRRRRHPHKQRPTPYRRNNITRRIRQQYQPQIRTIFLHRAPQRRLRIPRQMIRLIDDHHLESLLRREIHLLRLGDLLEQVLDDDAVEVSDVRGRDFEVVDRGDNVEFELAVGGRLEDACVDFDLFYAGAVEFFQCGYDAGFLAGA